MNYIITEYNIHKDDIIHIRTKVFIEEQACPPQFEWDEAEEIPSFYILAYDGKTPAGCIRLRRLNELSMKLERVAVMKEFRNQGVAREMVRLGILEALRLIPDCVIYAYAQLTALRVYTSLGFLIVSDTFLEEGTDILHKTIFYSNLNGLRSFLEAEKTTENHTYEEYEIHHPKIIERLQLLLSKFETFDYFNLCSLNLLLDSKIVTKIITKRLSLYCEEVEHYLTLNPFDMDREEHSEYSNESIESNSKFLFDTATIELNTGHFNEVDENWRKLYSIVSFLKSYVAFKENKFDLALRIADNGLCMGRVDESLIPIRRLARVIHNNIPIPLVHIHPMFSERSDFKPNQIRNLKPLMEINNSDNCFEQLISCLYSANPVIIRGYCHEMKAVEKWDFKYLLKEMHSRTFPVEVGSKYSDDHWSQKMMKFHNFLENSDGNNVYLAQHRLLEQVPHLMDDIDIPDICFNKSDDERNVDINLWIGPNGTVSPFHTDPRNNVFVQVHGKKLFRMVSPSNNDKMYPFDGMLSNTSQIDAESPDTEKYPLFKDVEVFEGIVGPGDALLIPNKWWHFVRSLSPSISISFWFD